MKDTSIITTPTTCKNIVNNNDDSGIYKKFKIQPDKFNLFADQISQTLTSTRRVLKIYKR